MNAIAAHKDELERLLVNLSGNTAVSGRGFLAFLDAYITRLDTNCSDISARVSPPRAQINGELTWNQHWLRTARFTTPNIKLRNVVRRFSRSFAVQSASRGRMFAGSWPLATYSSDRDFIRTTGAEPFIDCHYGAPDFVTTSPAHAEGILLPRLTPYASNPIPRN